MWLGEEMERRVKRISRSVASILWWGRVNIWKNGVCALWVAVSLIRRCENERNIPRVNLELICYGQLSLKALYSVVCMWFDECPYEEWRLLYVRCSIPITQELTIYYTNCCAVYGTFCICRCHGLVLGRRQS